MIHRGLIRTSKSLTKSRVSMERARYGSEGVLRDIASNLQENILARR
jgi:hypothetical protein